MAQTAPTPAPAAPAGIAGHAINLALDDPSGEVGFAAAKSLWDMGDKTGRAFIEDVVAGQQNATDGGVKGALRRADRLRYDPKKMAVIGAKSASGALLGPFNIGVLAAEQVFKGGAEAVRMQALNLLAEDCDAQTFKLLEVASTDDKTWAEKAAAAKALGTCGNPAAIPKLEQKWLRNKVVADPAAQCACRFNDGCVLVSVENVHAL